jgi:DNA helicase HerA-like ATPase
MFISACFRPHTYCGKTLSGRPQLNTLVVIDEAHRLAPRETPGDDAEKSVRALLIDAARTTRSMD